MSVNKELLEVFAKTLETFNGLGKLGTEVQVKFKGVSSEQQQIVGGMLGLTGKAVIAAASQKILDIMAKEFECSTIDISVLNISGDKAQQENEMSDVSEK